ncbi:hypothetical protein GQ53DRAFT_462818 [Thozetella sp. PMI_491]|nr:hypothetical protein GQ53DRAFT_462818 [Thozetella sp. PMI_491]
MIYRKAVDQKVRKSSLLHQRKNYQANMIIGVMQLYLHNAELTVRESFLESARPQGPTANSQIHRLQDLESVLGSIEGWLHAFLDIPLAEWVGISVETFTQFLHCLVVLFKLTILEEPGWDLEDLRRRADLFKILDRACEAIDSVPAVVGMVDAEGPCSGIFFKTTYLLRAIRTIFQAAMPAEMGHGFAELVDVSGSDGPSPQYSTDYSIPDSFLLGLSEEPWLSDIFDF